MIAHYFTLALRNLWKYRTQSIISVAGLAVGFVCFALANLWIHYEMTYDANRAGIDRTYFLCRPPMLGTGYTTSASYRMGEALRGAFPEVEAVCATDVSTPTTLSTKEGVTIETSSIDADSAFIAMYGSVRLLAGSWDFLHTADRVALTEETAVALFGTTDVLGRTVVMYEREMTVCALLNNQQRHSNFYFGCWEPPSRSREQLGSLKYAISVRLQAGTDVDAFVGKMQAYQPFFEEWGGGLFEGYILMPLAEYHYSDANSSMVIQFHYLILFSVVSFFIILCALFNYLSLFVVRMHNRVREGELRRVCGSSRGGLFVLFVTEYLWVLLIAGLIGMAVIEWVLPEFRRLSGVSGGIYAESLLYFAGLLLLSFLFLLPFVWRRQGASRRRNRHTFGRVSIVLQLVISLGFVFCVSVLMKQILYLKNTNLGWERHNTAVMWMYGMPADVMDELGAYVAATPLITEYLSNSAPLLPSIYTIGMSVSQWEGKEDDDQRVSVSLLQCSDDMLRFYGLQMLEGNWLDRKDPDGLVINQTLVKKMGMTNPVGKKIVAGNKKWYTIAGVVRDFHTNAPTAPVQAAVIAYPEALNVIFNGIEPFGSDCRIIKFEPGTYPQISADVDSILARHGVERTSYFLTNVEERYNEYLQAEDLLMKLLGMAALVCILTAAFGIFSLVSLSCEQRRKEIAIRKVNGARIGNILALFAREYLLMLVLAAVVAFPIGYVLMRRWLESYVEQTPISWWLYVAIFVGTAAVVALCIGWRVWQAARSNPAETIKTE